MLESLRSRLSGFVLTLQRARAARVPVVYVNDSWGRWDSDAPGLLRSALEGRGADVLRAIAPQAEDRFVLKPRYSAFDHTPLVILLRELEVERILIAGAATERCVVQSAIDARELGFKVTVLTDALATVDERMERLALEYAEPIVGAWLERADELDFAAALS